MTLTHPGYYVDLQENTARNDIAIIKVKHKGKTNPDGFEACPENGKLSGKIPMVLKPSGKWKMIWKSADSLSGFFCYTRKKFTDEPKNSGWQCYPATQVFAPLSLLSVRDKKERKVPQYWGMIKENNVCC